MRGLVTLLLSLVALRAEAQLSPRLRLVAHGLLPARALAGPDGRDPERALVTVRIAGGADRLRALGLGARPLSASVAALSADAATLAWLEAALPGETVRVEEWRPLFPLLDRAAAAVGAPMARAATGLSGRGVLVGVVDTGVDFHHADLRGADGSTRVAALLDQSTPADQRHAALGSFGGAIWLGDELDAAFAAEAAGMTPAIPVLEQDVVGHGTHVASIAVSNGLATGQGLPSGRYVGVAPEAELVIARASAADGSISDTGVLDACRFAVAMHDTLARPLVVNLSLGGTGGAHDGTSNLEAALDELFPMNQPGLALVIAAGNDGGNDMHAGGWALDGEVTLPLAVGAGGGMLAVDVWYRGDLSVAVEAPSGARCPFTALGAASDTTLADQGRVLVDNASGGTLSSAAAGAAIVLEAGAAGGPLPGAWKIVLSGRSIRYDAWLPYSALAATMRFTDRVDEDVHLALPATAHNAITVGSLISRLDWPTLDGRMFMPAGVERSAIGGVSFFTSSGPTADGRFAPDVGAPGEFVIAAMSRDATPAVATSVFRVDPSDLDALWADDGAHGVLRGTSQAAPLVAGAVALLFEAAPSLTSEVIREVLRSTAAPVPDTAGWSPRTGFGALDVVAALASLHGKHGGAVDPGLSRVGVSRDVLPPASEELTIVTVTPRDAAGVALGADHAVTIELSAGAPSGDVIDVGAGRYERSFVAHAPRGAVGVVYATVDGIPLAAHPSVYFVPSRDEIGGALTAGGGCALGSSPRTPSLLVLSAALLSIAIGLRRRRRAATAR